MALALGVFAAWRSTMVAADQSLAYFACHLNQLQPITLIMIAAGALIGFWVPFRSR